MEKQPALEELCQYFETAPFRPCLLNSTRAAGSSTCENLSTANSPSSTPEPARPLSNPYARITIHLVDGTNRTGVRAFPEPLNPDDIRLHALHLAAEVLGRSAISDVIVKEVPATDPAVIALILGEEKKKRPTPRSDGTHPYIKQQRRKTRH